MSTTEILSNYKNEIKTIETVSQIKESKESFLSGLCGNLNVIVPLSVTQKDRKCHCFIIADKEKALVYYSCLLYTSPSPRDQLTSRMPSSA